MTVNSQKQITLFDFDNCGNGRLILDVGYAAMLLFHHEPDKEAYEEKYYQFITGYGQIGDLSEEEIKLLPYAGVAIWIHYMGVHVQRYNDWSNVFFSENFLNYWIESAKRWLKYNKTIIN